MATTIPQRALRNANSSIIDRVIAGESFTVTRNGTPVADLVPHVAPDGPRTFVPTANLVDRLTAGLPRVDTDAWLRDIRAGDGDDDPFDARA